MSNKNTFNFLKVLMLIIGLVLVASPFFTSAQNVQAVYADDEYEYVPNTSIEQMHIDIDVHENGVLSTALTFKIKFLTDGLSEVMCYLPYSGNIYREEANNKTTQTPFIAKFSNYGCDFLSPSLNEKLNFYNDSTNAGNGYIAFGIKNQQGFFEKNSIREYRLFFDYDMRNTGTKNYDEIYCNLLGYNTPFEVKNITFKLTFPKDVDFATDMPEIYYGPAGEYNTIDQSTFTIVDGKTIVCDTPFNLDKECSLSLRQILPKGYLNITPRSTVWPIIYLVFTLVMIAVIIGVSIANSQRHEVVCPVEVLPPENVSPDIAEMYYKHEFTNKNLGALIIYFANKGFLKVKLDDNKKPVALIKVKNPPADFDAKLTSLFNGIFALSLNSKSETAEKVVALDSLNAESFYNKYKSLKTSREATIGSKLYQEKERKTIFAMRFVPIVSLIFLFVAMICQSKLYIGIVDIEAILAPIITVIFIAPVIIMSQFKTFRVYWFLIPWFIMSVVVLFVIYFTTTATVFDPYKLTLIGLLLTFGISLVRFKPKYTEQTAEMRGHILGLRNYIKMVEKDRLEMLVKENPHYYYDVLPFAYILGVSNIWIDKFKDIVLLPTDWVENNEAAMLTDIVSASTIVSMFKSINRSTTQSLRTAMTRSVSSSSFSGGRGFSSGGGSSGRGRSGGFSGGGGGGASFGAR